jgi:hypothetical protein
VAELPGNFKRSVQQSCQYKIKNLKERLIKNQSLKMANRLKKWGAKLLT